MPNLARAFNHCLLISLLLWPLPSHAGPFAAKIDQVEWLSNTGGLHIQTKIDYQLSPTVKEALHKGVPLTWVVWLEIREIGRLLDSTVYSQNLPYRLQYHALLNQYEVLTRNDESEMFLTLNAALGFMSNLQAVQPIPAGLLQAGKRYKLALKCHFDRELLPVPLRPFSYLDTQWFLSSDWYIWPIQK